MGKKNLIDKVMKKTAESTRNPFTKLLIGITAFATAYSLISPAVALEGTDAEEVLGDEQTEETVTKEPEVTEIPTEITTEEAPAQQEQTADEQPAVTETQDEEQPAVTDTQEEEPAQAPADETQLAEGEQAEEEPAEEAVAQSRTVYEYVEEGVLKVTATLSDPAAVPDEAELVVTPVTADLEEYNYDAYLEALNKSTEEKEYTPENTLLYDVAFMLDGVEIQPATGTVAVNFEFLNNHFGGRCGRLGGGALLFFICFTVLIIILIIILIFCGGVSCHIKIHVAQNIDFFFYHFIFGGLDCSGGFCGALLLSSGGFTELSAFLFCLVGFGYIGVVGGTAGFGYPGKLIISAGVLFVDKTVCGCGVPVEGDCNFTVRTDGLPAVVGEIIDTAACGSE